MTETTNLRNDVRQDLQLRSKVGDYIWKRLAQGSTADQVKKDLAHYVDTINERIAIFSSKDPS